MEIAELLGRQEHQIELLGGRRGHRPERGGFVLPQRQTGFGKQAGHRHHGGAQRTDGRIVAVALGDAHRRRHRVEPARADLVGAREHRDGVDGRSGSNRSVHERVEELDVAAMEVAHQVDHGVGVGRMVAVVIEELTCPARVLVVE